MYDSDVSDEEWELIKHNFDPVDKRGGACKKHAKRDIVNAIFYLSKTGVQSKRATVPHSQAVTAMV